MDNFERESQTIQQLFPNSLTSIDLDFAYSLDESFENLPFLRINMVSSLDGVTVIDGKSESLSGPADKAVFRTLRQMSDVILVGAETFRVEEYRPINFDKSTINKRLARGQKGNPPIAIVTKNAHLDFDSPLFNSSQVRNIILTSDQGAKNIRGNNKFKDSAEIVVCGEEEVDLKYAKSELGSLGYNHILCEGGPSINAQLLALDVVDEVCLSISPVIVQGKGLRIFEGDELKVPSRFQTTHIFQGDGFIFLRTHPEH